MRIGVACLYYEVEKTLDLIEKNKDFIKHLEIGIDKVTQIDEIAPFISKIEELGLSIGVHLAMEINTSEEIEYIRNSWAKFCEDIYKGVEVLKPAYLNLHMGYAIKSRFLNNKKKYLDNTVDFFFELSKIFRKLSRIPVITVENSYSFGCGEMTNTGISTGEFEYIFEKTKDIRKNYNMPYFCFDTGHCVLSRDDYSRLKKFTKVIHISDCDGKEDNHLEIFCGKLSFEDLNLALNMQPEYAVIEVKFENIEKSICKLKNFLSCGRKSYGNFGN